MGMSIGMGFMLLGGYMGYKGNKQSGKMAEQMGQYNAAVNEIKAKDAEKRGGEDEFFYRLRTRKMIGEQRVAFAASGVDVGDMDSTASNVTADTAKMGEIDALTIRANAAREAWGFRTQGEQDIMTGKMQKFQSDQAAMGALLGGASNAFALKYGFGRKT
jgi:hypothetical protein